MSNLSLFTTSSSHYELLTPLGYLSESFTNPLLHHLTQAGKTEFRCVLHDRLDEAAESQVSLLVMFHYSDGICVIFPLQRHKLPLGT